MALFEDATGIPLYRRSWMSNSLWESVLEKALAAGGKFVMDFKFSKPERKVMRKRKVIQPSVWAEKHRVLTMSVLPGLWRNEVTPYLVGIMDGAALPYVREVNICKAPQTGVSEVAHNFVGYCIDRAPGPVLYVYPDETSAKENSQDRILPMINSSTRLRSYFTGADRDKSNLRINLQHMPIYLGWARSASRLANKPIKYAIADEIDKDGFDAGEKEAGPLDLIDKRLITFRNVSKYWKISTPSLESGNIWREYNNAQVRFDYHVSCPFCSRRQLMDFKDIKWEGGSKADPREVRTRHLAWYECQHCHERWNDSVRNRAVQAGEWIEPGSGLALMTYLEMFRPATIAFHIPSWISFFVSLSDAAAAFIEGQHDLLKLHDFLNSHCGLPWKDRVVKGSEENVLQHKNDLPAGVVPDWAVALTVGIDMQKHGFWYVVRAWGRNLTSHMVQHGFLNGWADVETLCFDTRYPVDGGDTTMGVWRGALDTGGGITDDDDWTRTEEAYHWLRKNGRGVIFGIKGASKPQLKRVVHRVIDKMPRGNRPIPGGLVLYLLDTAQFKDLFHWRLGRRHVPGPLDEEGQEVPVESQCMTLNADAGMDYASQVMAEEKQKDRKGNTSWVAVRRDNHLLDCEVYASACADPEWTPSLIHLAPPAPTRVNVDDASRPEPPLKGRNLNPWNKRKTR